MDAKTEAHALHLAIAYHAATTADAIAWADGLVATTDSPSDELVAISLASQLQDGAVLDLLSAVPGIPNRQHVASKVLGYISRALSSQSMSGLEAAAAIEHMVLNGWVPCQEAESEMYAFHDRWMLAQMGGEFGSTEDVRSQIAEFVKQHAV